MNYTLKNAYGIVGRVSLFKPSYKLGEDVTGTFDLSSATVACLQVSTRRCTSIIMGIPSPLPSREGLRIFSQEVYYEIAAHVNSLFPQFSVALQCVEEVHQESLQREATVHAVCSTHSRHSESCPNTLLTHFALPIPLTVTQSFQNTTGDHFIAFRLQQENCPSLISYHSTSLSDLVQCCFSVSIGY